LRFGRDRRSRGASAIPSYQFSWVAQELFFRNILSKFCAQKPFIRRVLEQASNQISHAWKQLADRTIFADTIAHFYQRTLDRAGHPVEQLRLKAAAIYPELVRKHLCVRDTASVVGAEGSGDDGFIFEKHARERLEIRVALGLLKKDWRM